MQISIGTKINGGGVTIERSENRSIEGVDSREISLPVGIAGTLSTRYDGSEGTLTMLPGHGIATGNIIDVYWEGGVQLRLTVGTVNVNDLDVAGGHSDNFPPQDTPIVACVRVAVNLQIAAAQLSLLAVEASRADATDAAQAVASLREADTSEVVDLVLNPNVPQVFDADGTADNDAFVGNPLDADVASLSASNGSAANVCTIKLIVASDATP